MLYLNFKTFSTHNIKFSNAISLIFSFLVFSLTLHSALAQDLLKIQAEATPAPLPSKVSIIEALQDTIERIESSEKLLNQADQKSSNYRQDYLIIEHLNQIRLTYKQQIEILEEIKVIKEQATEIALKLENLDSEESQKLIPQNFEESERLRDEISVAKDSNKKNNSRLKNARDLLEQAKSALEQQEQSLRILTNSLPPELKEDAQSFAVQAKELEVKYANENLILQRLQVELEKSNLKKNSLTLKLLKKRLESAKESALFNRSDFQRRLAQIEESEQNLKIEQEQNKQELESAEKFFSEAKAKIEARDENSASAQELDQLEAARNVKLSAQVRTRIITERLQRLAVIKGLWEARYNNRLKNLQKEIILPLREKASAMLERLIREKNLQLSELDETRKKLAQLDDRINNLEKNSKQRIWIKENKLALEKLASAYDGNLMNIDSAISLHQNFLAESAEQIGNNSWTIFAQEAGSAIMNLWNYELFASGDYPVTVGKLIFGIFLLILGYFASDLLSRKLIAKLLKRFNMTQGAIAAIQALTFYLLLIAFALAALRIVNVPLTVFTVLGGALAIGVGFGSQNVMNNFISGLILLTEQPIRVGDMIEVDSFTGIVKKIGARSTIIRTGNNIEIVVPNSAFLEKNVINWTRNNSQARLCVNVGVEYSSDVDLVTQTLIKSVSYNNKILPSPKPFVWFTSFGESTLNFEIHFWVNVRSATEKNSIESEIRYEINKLFAENKINFAFPHRALYSTKPLEVRLRGNSNV